MRTKQIKLGEDLVFTVRMRGPLGYLDIAQAAGEEKPMSPLTVLFKPVAGSNPTDNVYGLAQAVFADAITSIDMGGRKVSPKEFDFKNDLNFKEFWDLFNNIMDYWGITQLKLAEPNKFREDSAGKDTGKDSSEIPGSST